MRLIDADTLEKQFGVSDADLLALDEIRRAPTVDAEVVVRCKECIHCGFCGDATNLQVMGFYGFCSRGERKDGGDDRV